MLRKDIHMESPYSSNINEVFKTVLNFLLFFCEKILHAPKSTKKHKAQKKKKKKKKKNATKQKHKTQISEQKNQMCLKNI